MIENNNFNNDDFDILIQELNHINLSHLSSSISINHFLKDIKEIREYLVCNVKDSDLVFIDSLSEVQKNELLRSLYPFFLFSDFKEAKNYFTKLNFGNVFKASDFIHESKIISIISSIEAKYNLLRNNTVTAYLTKSILIAIISSFEKRFQHNLLLKLDTMGNNDSVKKSKKLIQFSKNFKRRYKYNKEQKDKKYKQKSFDTFMEDIIDYVNEINNACNSKLDFFDLLNDSIDMSSSNNYGIHILKESVIQPLIEIKQSLNKSVSEILIDFKEIFYVVFEDKYEGLFTEDSFNNYIIKNSVIYDSNYRSYYVDTVKRRLGFE